MKIVYKMIKIGRFLQKIKFSEKYCTPPARVYWDLAKMQGLYGAGLNVSRLHKPRKPEFIEEKSGFLNMIF